MLTGISLFEQVKCDLEMWGYPKIDILELMWDIDDAREY
jgi:hypothetical protein